MFPASWQTCLLFLLVTLAHSSQLPAGALSIDLRSRFEVKHGEKDMICARAGAKAALYDDVMGHTDYDVTISAPGVIG